MKIRTKTKWYLVIVALISLLCLLGINHHYKQTLISEAKSNIRSHSYKVSNRGIHNPIRRAIKNIIPSVKMPKYITGEIGILRSVFQEPCHVADIVDDLKTISPLIEDFDCERAKVGDEEAIILGQMHQLTRLSFDGTDLTDEGAQSLSQLTKLGWLSIHAPQLTDKGMSWITNCPDLWRIYLTDAKIGNETLQALSNLPKLKTVYLYSSTVYSSDLRHLKKLKKLRWLVLEDTNIDDEAAPHLKHLNSIERLELGQTQVGDAVCEAVTKIANLRTLRLNKTAISDKGVRTILEGCQELKELWISDCHVTANAFSGLNTWPKNLEILYLKGTNMTGSEALQILRKHSKLLSIGYGAKDMSPEIREQFDQIYELRQQDKKR